MITVLTMGVCYYILLGKYQKAKDEADELTFIGRSMDRSLNECNARYDSLLNVKPKVIYLKPDAIETHINSVRTLNIGD